MDDYLFVLLKGSVTAIVNCINSSVKDICYTHQKLNNSARNFSLIILNILKNRFKEIYSFFNLRILCRKITSTI